MSFTLDKRDTHVTLELHKCPEGYRVHVAGVSEDPKCIIRASDRRRAKEVLRDKLFDAFYKKELHQ